MCLYDGSLLCAALAHPIPSCLGQESSRPAEVIREGHVVLDVCRDTNVFSKGPGVIFGGVQSLAANLRFRLDSLHEHRQGGIAVPCYPLVTCRTAGAGMAFRVPDFNLAQTRLALRAASCRTAGWT